MLSFKSSSSPTAGRPARVGTLSSSAGAGGRKCARIEVALTTGSRSTCSEALAAAFSSRGKKGAPTSATQGSTMKPVSSATNRLLG